MQVATTTATLGAVLIAGLLSLLGYRLLVRPIRRLVAAQAAVVGGDDLPRRGSEIAQLESTFARLLEVEQEREAIGEVFLGRYRVIGRLGSGGSGTVFRGFDPVPQRGVALKAVPLESADQGAESLVTKLRAEAVHLARLNHPNIVGVFDFERRGDTAYIAMERVDGVSLARYLAHNGRLQVREGVGIGGAVTAALAAAHGVELVHGDLKPANILLGKDRVVKVADFGTAQLLQGAAYTGARLQGTAGYIAPEVLQKREWTRASDLFALGVVLYEMFAGRRPFGEGSLSDILRRTLEQDAADLAKLRPTLPDELCRLVMCLLAKDPRDRPTSARAVADALERMKAGLDQDWKLDLEAVIERPDSGATEYLTQYFRETLSRS
jgi:serine/threonine-protein kinase